MGFLKGNNSFLGVIMTFKNIFYVMALVLAALVPAFSQASSLNCGDSNKAGGKSYTVLVAGTGHFSCWDGESAYEVHTNGVQFGLYGAAQMLTIDCTGDEPSGIYYGVKLDVAAVIGFEVGYFFGEKGTCTLAGGAVGLGGFSVGVPKLKIEKRVR